MSDTKDKEKYAYSKWSLQPKDPKMLIAYREYTRKKIQETALYTFGVWIMFTIVALIIALDRKEFTVFPKRLTTMVLYFFFVLIPGVIVGLGWLVSKKYLIAVELITPLTAIATFFLVLSTWTEKPAEAT